LELAALAYCSATTAGTGHHNRDQKLGGLQQVGLVLNFELRLHIEYDRTLELLVSLASEFVPDSVPSYAWSDFPVSLILFLSLRVENRFSVGGVRE